MNLWIETVLVFLVLTGFLLLGSSRLAACIRAVALQGVLLGFLTLAAQDGQVSFTGTLLALSSAAVKGFVLPWLLFRAMREADMVREVEPLVGYNLSILSGAAGLAVSLWLGQHLLLPVQPGSFFSVPAAFFTSLAGLFVIISRRKALTQVLGYLSLENGVYAFGVAAAPEMPVFVELGILLDLLVAVFVMGIAIFHISREFDHIDTDRLATLTDPVR